MRKKCIIILLIIALLASWQGSYVTAAIIKPEKDSRELQFQDMLLLFLLPYMNDKLAEVYSKELIDAPDLYPYFVDVIHVERVNGFRGFDFLIMLDATPTVGPHIPVGRDLFTFEISSGVQVKLKNYQHLKGPNKKDFRPII
ncbi:MULTISPECIES: DUF3888 domain-containing protein [unclassified Paenibacillus]|uniref:DUF3888 domain-containing protein n=1 Tax=unclassified Paenibacillus TaxID=185978 RepID=UPI0036312C7C